MPMPKITIAGRTFKLPASRLARIAIGISLIVGGVLGFLPFLGFWMVPLGLMVLSIDIPVVRTWRRRTTVKLGSWLKKNHPKLANKLGFNRKE